MYSHIQRIVDIYIIATVLGDVSFARAKVIVGLGPEYDGYENFCESRLTVSDEW